MPRIYREVPLQSLWEGSGNVQALDVLRAVRTSPESVDALLDEIAGARGADERLDVAAAELRRQLADTDALEYRARTLAEQLACILQAALLVRHAPAAVADAYCATRLPGAARQLNFGALPRGCDTDTIIVRATPTLA